MFLCWTFTSYPIHQEKKRDQRRQQTQCTGCFEAEYGMWSVPGWVGRVGTSGVFCVVRSTSRCFCNVKLQCFWTEQVQQKEKKSPCQNTTVRQYNSSKDIPEGQA